MLKPWPANPSGIDIENAIVPMSVKIAKIQNPVLIS